MGARRSGLGNSVRTTALSSLESRIPSPDSRVSIKKVDCLLVSRMRVSPRAVDRFAGGVMVKFARVAILALAAVAFGESAASAQVIAGIVRDASGGVMPGVTVEASSPALIEKTRTVVSDGEGQYKIINLSPGTYVVTFTLVGFNTVRREGIEITNDFTAGVNAEMKVGAIEETIT